MKIMVVSQYYFPEPFRISDICETLVKRGHSVTVLTAQPNYPEGKIYNGYINKYQFELINGVNVYRTKIHPRNKGSINLFLNYISFPFYSRKVLKRLDKDFDLVFINQLSPVFSAIPGIKYAKRHKVKSFLYCLDLWPESLVSGGIREGSLIYRFFNNISKKIYKKVDHILVTSKSFSEKFDKYGKKSIYLPQYAEDSFQYIEKLDDGEKKFHCVFAGNIGEMQSVDTIIFAANILRSNNDIVFDIYGNGSKYEYVQSLIRGLELNNVVLHGRKSVEQMSNIYSKSDVLIVTLKKDKQISMTLPGKVQSYLATGKPIIGCADGETRMILEESQAGYTCEAEDYVKLSQLILDAKNNNELSKMGLLGLEYYKLNFSKNNFFFKLEKILTEEDYV